MPPLIFRPASLDAEDDLDFILGTWLDSYRTAHSAGLIQMSDWGEVMAPQFLAVLERSDCTTILAEKPGEPRPHNLYGWIAVERTFSAPARQLHPGSGTAAVEARRPNQLVPSDRPLVHYVYTKSAYREKGLARALFRHAGVNPFEPFLFSCKTGWASRLKHKAPGGDWAPLVARFQK